MGKIKHIEVKPSKFKTSLCQYFLIQRECPFGARCVFAHGEDELQVEEKNIELMRASGVQRLNELFGGATLGESEMDSATWMTSSNTECDRTAAPAASCYLDLTHAKVHATRRRAILVSLPKRGTGSERYLSPYANEYNNHSYSSAEGICHRRDAVCNSDINSVRGLSGAAASPKERGDASSGDSSASQKHRKQAHDTNILDVQLGPCARDTAKCAPMILSSCRYERSLIYRHNPYRIY